MSNMMFMSVEISGNLA